MEKDFCCLTQEQVDNLPEGTKIFVKWPGANRPWPYVVHYRFDGVPFAKLTGVPWPYVVHYRFDGVPFAKLTGVPFVMLANGDPDSIGILRPVGNAPLIQVWLRD